MVEHYRGLWGCYVLEKTDSGESVQLTELELIHQKDQRVFVRGAIQAGDNIVVSGVHRLVANQSVRSVILESHLAQSENH